LNEFTLKIPFILNQLYVDGEHFKKNCHFDLIQGEKLSFRLIPSLTQSHTKTFSETVREDQGGYKTTKKKHYFLCVSSLREEVILAKERISLIDNSVSPCMLVDQRELKEGDWDILSGCPLDLNCHAHILLVS